MKKIIVIILVIPLFVVGCTQYCRHHIPDDMASYLPDNMQGKVFVYVNSAGDTLTLTGGEHFVQPDEEYTQYFCSKCGDCIFMTNMWQGFYCHGEGFFGSNASIKIEGEETYYVSTWIVSDDRYRDMRITTPALHATFDDEEHFVTRDFGDTLVMTRQPNRWIHDDIPDTAVWVRGYGFIRINDYRLASILSPATTTP